MHHTYRKFLKSGNAKKNKETALCVVQIFRAEGFFIPGLR